jgi:hypothetical protein
MAADAPVQRGIVVRKGFSFLESVVVFDKTTGLVRNLTGYAPRLVINPADGSAQIVITTSNGLTLTPLLGRIDIAIPDDTTVTWTFNSGEYSLGIDNGQGNGHEALMFGAVVVRSIPV